MKQETMPKKKKIVRKALDTPPKEFLYDTSEDHLYPKRPMYRKLIIESRLLEHIQEQYEQEKKRNPAK
jgi:hypothetical protein